MNDAVSSYRWEEQESEMLYPRGSLAVTALGDAVYAIGGFDSQEALTVVEVMDTRTMKWHSLANLSAERAYGEATVVNDQVQSHSVLDGTSVMLQSHAILTGTSVTFQSHGMLLSLQPFDMQHLVPPCV